MQENVPTPLTITQDQYRKLLEADLERATKRFVEFPEAKEGERWRCRKCATAAEATIIAHPIWDGPFDGTGRGKCDYREIPFYPSCDGEQAGWEDGPPIRIPFPLTGEPVQIMKRLADCLHRFGPHPILLKARRRQKELPS